MRLCIPPTLPSYTKDLDLTKLKYLVIHKTSLSRKGSDNPEPIADIALTGTDLCNAFMLNPLLGTYGLIPYHILIENDGSVDQILPLSKQAAHARAYNKLSWGVAIVGDLDKYPCSSAQWDSLVWVTMVLMIANHGLDVVGHTDLRNASRDMTKKCPGRFLSTHQLEMTALGKNDTSFLTMDQQEWVNRIKICEFVF